MTTEEKKWRVIHEDNPSWSAQVQCDGEYVFYAATEAQGKTAVARLNALEADRAALVEALKFTLPFLPLPRDTSDGGPEQVAVSRYAEQRERLAALLARLGSDDGVTA